MIQTALQWIADQATAAQKIQTMEINGRTYTKDKLQPVNPPQPDSLTVHSLTGIVDFINATTPAAFEGLLIHVLDHRNVYLTGPLNSVTKKRPNLMHSHFDAPQFRFEHWFDLETFIIQLQSHFKVDTDCEKILKFVSKISHDQSAAYEDTGITQTVATKKGFTQTTVEDVPNPVSLTPYRTFPEIEQPASFFVFRVRIPMGQENAPPQCALFEADGGHWIHEARQRISDWFTKTTIKDVPVIA